MSPMTTSGTAARPAPPVGLPTLPAARAADGTATESTVVRRLLAAAVWVACGKLLGLWLSGLPIASLLGTTSVTFVTAAVLFGWPGLIAAAAVQVLYIGVLEGFGATYTWTSSAAYTGAAAIAWLVFRYVPGLSRRFSDVRSVAWFAGAGAAGAVLSAGVITLTGDHTDQVLQQVALWSRSTLVSVWVFCPALILLAERHLGRALAPVPGEPTPAAPRRVALVSEEIAGQPVQVTQVELRELHVARAFLPALAATAVVAVGKLAVADPRGHDFAWWNLLFLLPIWWLSREQRLPGALVGSALVSATVLATDVAVASAAGSGLPASVALALYAQLLVYLFVAVLLGAGAEREGRLLEGLADLHGRLAQDLQRVVRALTGAVAAKDEYTEGHLQRVNAYALEVGRRLGLGARDLELLQIAGTLHDIGKIGIPEHILNKPGPLSPAEREVLQRHPEIGARMLSRIDGLRDAAPLVLHHQERWDGARDGAFPGYPAGLAGERIPLGARIIAVVDAFDAMTTDRPYRRGLGHVVASDVLRTESGHQFDPRVVETFLGVLAERPWS
jgi:HD-GYP domain-containing protein (c-di-GMP phosphodiesterase class II)